MKRFEIRMSDEEWEYFKVCARIRDVSISSLFKRLFTVISDDKLIESILDDDGKRKRYKSEPKFKE